MPESAALLYLCGSPWPVRWRKCRKALHCGSNDPFVNHGYLLSASHTRHQRIGRKRHPVPRDEIRGRFRFAEMEALAEVATHFLQQALRGCILDAFRSRFEAEVVRESHDRF